MFSQILPVKVPVNVVGELIEELTANVRTGPNPQLFCARTDTFPPLNPEVKLTVMLVVPWPPVIVAPVGTVHA